MIPNPMLPLIYKMTGHFVIFGTAAGGLLALDINFKDQITLGSIIIAALILIVAGTITIRSKIATIWREEAEGQRVAKERLQEELNHMIVTHAEFEKHQQELRHDLKNQIAGLNASIKVMEAKTDLSSALEAIKQISISQAEGHHQTHVLLEEIRDKLPSEPLQLVEPINVREVGGEHVDSAKD